MFETYGFPILLFAGLGLLAAILLTVFSKLFAVKTDDRIAAVDNVLPHANCGACGYAGCIEYAEAVVNNNLPTNLCKVGGPEVSDKIAEILGKPAMEFKPEIAVVHCRGTCDKVERMFQFDGIQSCHAAKHYFSGSNSCIYGCIGLGDCMNACAYDAIRMIDGIANIQPGLCRACGSCAKVCPNELISLRPTTKHFDVRCSSKATGKATKLLCSSGCIGCRICEKKCEYDAIHVIDHHAVIDYDKCQSCGVCCEVCPTHAICNCENTD